MRKLVLELLRYGLVSVAALAADVVVLHTLVESAGWHYLAASGLAFITGAGLAYVLSVRFVFGFRQLSSRTLEFGYFLSLGVAGLLVNAAVLSVAISAAGLGLIAAKLFAAVCTFATNFTLRRVLLFSPPRISR